MKVFSFLSFFGGDLFIFLNIVPRSMWPLLLMAVEYIAPRPEEMEEGDSSVGSSPHPGQHHRVQDIVFTS